MVGRAQPRWRNPLPGIFARQVLLQKLDSSQESVMQKMDSQKATVYFSGV